MSSHSALAVLLLSLLLGIPKAGGADEVPSPEPYREAFFSTLERLNGALKSEGLPDLSFDFKRVRVVLSEDHWCPGMVKVHVNPAFSVEFLPQTDSSRRPRIAFVSRGIPLGWLGSYDTPPKATWTSDQAVQKCKFWYEAVYGEPLAHVGAAEAEYSDQMNLPKYRNGQWIIRWPRIDAHGHRFLVDNIYCTLDEKYGANFLGRHFVSTFAEDQKMLVSAEEAMAIARPVAKELLTGPMTSPWSRDLTLKAEAKAEVLIVNANHLLKYKTVEEMPLVGDAVARLAWVAKFLASDDKATNAYIYLWIDTETKEVLGGDFGWE